MQLPDDRSVQLATLQREQPIVGLDAILKTAIDYTLACATLIVLSPILLTIGLVVSRDTPGPALHRRRVLGLGGKTFDAFKFRTMIDQAERRRRHVPIDFPDRRTASKSREDPRVTRIGRFLRRTSLDEVPQLINVLRGEMSLVGPRMIAPDEWARYGKWQPYLLTVKPGLTGPWQVRGRGDLAYDERGRLSVQYIGNYSVRLDLDILMRTVGVVLLGRGAY